MGDHVGLFNGSVFRAYRGAGSKEQQTGGKTGEGQCEYQRPQEQAAELLCKRRNGKDLPGDFKRLDPAEIESKHRHKEQDGDRECDCQENR